jgi:hypothetical protein
VQLIFPELADHNNVVRLKDAFQLTIYKRLRCEIIYVVNGSYEEFDQAAVAQFKKRICRDAILGMIDIVILFHRCQCLGIRADVSLHLFIHGFTSNCRTGNESIRDTNRSEKSLSSAESIYVNLVAEASQLLSEA